MRKCDLCDENAVSVAMIIPKDLSIDHNAVQEVVGAVESYCLLHYNKVYGLTIQQECDDAEEEHKE